MSTWWGSPGGDSESLQLCILPVQETPPGNSYFRVGGVTIFSPTLEHFSEWKEPLLIILGPWAQLRLSLGKRVTSFRLTCIQLHYRSQCWSTLGTAGLDVSFLYLPYSCTSAVQWNFLRWWKCSVSVLSNTITTTHMWLLSTWNVASVAKELKLKFYLMLTSRKVNDHMWLEAPVLHDTD